MDAEFNNVKHLLKTGFNRLEDANNNVVRNSPKSTKRNPQGTDKNEAEPRQHSGPEGSRKRSLSRGRGRGRSKGPNKAMARAQSRGPPTKTTNSSRTPCPFCNEASCPSPTRCAISYDWQSRIAVHTRKLLCPQYTCLKSHRDKCWKVQTTMCSYCEGPHHLAWCRDLAMSSVRSNVGSEPYDPRD